MRRSRVRRCRDGQPRRTIGSAWVAGFVPREGRPCHSDSGDGDDDSDVCDDDDDDGGGGGDDDDGGFGRSFGRTYLEQWA